MTQYSRPLPVVEELWYNGHVYLVVRDDLMIGGTKAACIPCLFDDHMEYVYPSPVQGFAQIALAKACADAPGGRQATIVCAHRNVKHPRTIRASMLNARLLEVKPGYLSVVKKRAEDYCKTTGAKLLPWGLDCPEMVQAISERALMLDFKPGTVWCIAGSGTLTRGLQKAWPYAEHHVVQVGASPTIGNAKLHVAPEGYEQDAKLPPPYPSCSNYDAKLWQYVVNGQIKPGALIWNVAGGY